MPSSTNWSSDWLEPVSTLSLLKDSETAGRTIQLVSVEPAACAASRALTKLSKLVRLAPGVHRGVLDALKPARGLRGGIGEVSRVDVPGDLCWPAQRR